MDLDTVLETFETGASVASDLSSVGRFIVLADRSRRTSAPKECLQRGRQHLRNVVDTLESHETKIPVLDFCDLCREHDTYVTVCYVVYLTS